MVTSDGHKIAKGSGGETRLTGSHSINVANFIDCCTDLLLEFLPALDGRS